jgi:hypothetical protein
MGVTKASEQISHDRRRFLEMAEMAIAVAGTTSLLPSQLAAACCAARRNRIDR